MTQLLVALIAALAPAPAQAKDLLVAPTRAVFEGRTRSAEITLKNTGTEAATYAVSLVARRMTEEGNLDAPETMSAAEELAAGMIRFAPRRVYLEPGQYQSVRLALRKPADLAAGEYRIHMMFRALPRPRPIAAQTLRTNVEGIGVQLIPIYGVTIPIIVRQGELDGGARLLAATTGQKQKLRGFELRLERLGERSFYSDIEVVRAGAEEPIAELRGIAIYPELKQRTVFVPLKPGIAATDLSGAVVRVYEVDGARRTLVEERPVQTG